MSDRNLTLWDSDKYDWDGTRDRIVDLIARGYSIAYTAKAVGLPPSTVQRLIKSEFQSRNSSRQQTIEAHAQTVNWLKVKVTDRIAEADKLWDRKDAELLLKILEREAKLYGVDQPVQHNVTHTIEEQTDEEIISQLSAMGIVLQLPSSPPSPPAPSPQQPPPPVEDAHFEVADGSRAAEATPSEDQR